MVKVGLKILEAEVVAVIGSNEVSKTDLSMKSTENYVCAAALLIVVSPVVSNSAVKALIEPSVVIFGLAMW